MEKHTPGCASSRQRPCICGYLWAWDPAKPGGVINIDELFKSPAVQAELDRLGQLFRKQALTFKSADGRKRPALTPQLRDRIRMGALEKSAIESATITEEGVMLRVKWTRPDPRDLLTSTNYYTYLQRKNDYLAETARFYRQLSLYLLALLIPASILATGAMLGWWW